MSKLPFDAKAAHKHFSAHCFNKTWELIEKPSRLPDEDEEMISMCHASLWHWTQREDCAPRNLSIGYWQLSRVYSLAQRSDEARRYGRLSLFHAEKEPAFYRAYA